MFRSMDLPGILQETVDRFMNAQFRLNLDGWIT